MCTRAIWARTFQAVCRKKSRDTKRSPGAEQRAGCLRSPPEPAKFLLCRDRARGSPSSSPASWHLGGLPRPRVDPAVCGMREQSGVTEQYRPPCHLPSARGRNSPPSKRRREAGPSEGKWESGPAPKPASIPSSPLPGPARAVPSPRCRFPVGDSGTGHIGAKTSGAGNATSSPPPASPHPSHPSPGPDPSLTPPGASRTTVNGRWGPAPRPPPTPSPSHSA